MPGIRTVLGVVHHGTEERWRKTIQVRARFANDMACDELWRVFKHVNEAVQFAQDIVGDMPRRAGFTVKINRDIGVLVANLFYKGPQRFQRYLGFLGRAGAELFIVDRENEGGCARLLLGELRQVDVTSHPEHFHAFALERIG